ncbi:MAG: oxaloacetate-decarboxylating malate dehydrogenase, partial [Candidatus Sericytochromatia bacterium]|nr:oxaloacetate-decarboxylating malate dehydrogenase [Candidatus Tanganyikabacteria bacterium]
EYLADPLYLGLRRNRVRGADYDEFVAEFVEAVQTVMPRALIQFEDFANINAFRLLEHWRDRVCTFNDDIQGTAAVTLAGLYSALRLTKGKLTEQKILFLGAGEAGIGIADLIVSAMVDEGLDLETARRNCWFVDTKGLVVRSRADLAEHKRRYAHEFPHSPDFLSAINALNPHAIIGVSTISGAFSPDILGAMARLNEHPIIFALSNPTSKAECTAEAAYSATGGRAIYASGSPFPPVVHDGRKFIPGQGNNAYIFPGVGLGVMAAGARRVTDLMFSKAARALADQVLEGDLAVGRIYPALTRIRELSAAIGAAVAEVAFEHGLESIERPADLLAHVKAQMWEPEYPTYA